MNNQPQHKFEVQSRFGYERIYQSAFHAFFNLQIAGVLLVAVLSFPCSAPTPSNSLVPRSKNDRLINGNGLVEHVKKWSGRASECYLNFAFIFRWPWE